MMNISESILSHQDFCYFLTKIMQKQKKILHAKNFCLVTVKTIVR